MGHPPPPGTPRGAWPSLTEAVRQAEQDVCPRCDVVRVPVPSQVRAWLCRCAAPCGLDGCGAPRPEPDWDLRGGWEQADDTASAETIEYPCPECGFGGPHAVHRDEDGAVIAACGDVRARPTVDNG